MPRKVFWWGFLVIAALGLVVKILGWLFGWGVAR